MVQIEDESFKVIVDETDTDNVYVGRATWKSSEAAAVWQIRKIVTSGS